MRSADEAESVEDDGLQTGPALTVMGLMVVDGGSSCKRSREVRGIAKI